MFWKVNPIIHLSLVALIALAATPVHAAAVNWVPDADGNWEDAANWFKFPPGIAEVPDDTDGVTIDVGGATVRTITIASADQHVVTVTSMENLSVIGGDLTLDFMGTIDAAATFTLGGNRDLTVGNGGFTAAGPTFIDGGRVFTSGPVDFSNVTSYDVNVGGGALARTLEADGPDAAINLSNLTSLTGGTSIRAAHFTALDGGSINLIGLSNVISASARFVARDTGSVIDLSNMTAFTQSAGQAALEVSNGGDILTSPGLTTLAGVDVTIDGAGSTLDISNVTDFTDGELTLRSGAAGNLNSVTMADGASFFINHGATFSVPGISSYNVNGAGFNDRTFEADGSGSVLDMSQVTDITGGTGLRTLVMRARNGGMVDMSGLTVEEDGSLQFVATDSGSVVDVSNMTSLVRTSGDAGRLEATSGGTILTSPGLTKVVDVQVVIGGVNSAIDLSAVTDFTDSELELLTDGTVDLNGIGHTVGAGFSNQSGLAFALPGMTSYDTNGVGFLSRRFEAVDPGSSLDLSNLTALTGGTGLRALEVRATDGGTVDMTGLTVQENGSVQFQASGAGSVIDVSNMTSFVRTDGEVGRLEVIDGGEITTAGALLVKLQEIHVLVDGAASVLDLSGVTDFTDSELTLKNGGSVDLNNIASVTGASFFNQSGQSFAMAGLTSYDTNGSDFSDRTFEADGAGSVLDMSNLTSVVGGTGLRRLNVNALDGGRVDMTGLTVQESGSLGFLAEGSGSVVDVSNMTSYVRTEGERGRMAVIDGGTILTSPLLTKVQDVEVEVDGAASSVDLSQVVDFTDGGVELLNGGTLNMSSVTIAAGASFVNRSGSSFALPALVAYDAEGSSVANETFEADGAGSDLDFSQITTITGATGVRTLEVNALNGAVVDLSGLAQITSGSARILADGANSRVDLTAMTLFNKDTGATAFIEATNGGTVDMHPVNATANGVEVRVNALGSINVGTLALGTGASLEGDCQLNGGLTYVLGLVAPGTSAGDLIVDGDFDNADGTVEFEIIGTQAGEFDTLQVTGNTTLSGAISVVIDEDFDLVDGLSFLVLVTDGSVTGMFDGIGQADPVATDNGYNLLIDYGGGNGNDVRLYSQIVPEPGMVIMLVALGLPAGLRRRR